MKKVAFENHVIKIHYDEDHSYILLEWLSPVLHAEYVHAFNVASKVITEKKITKLIADIRLLGALTDESVAISNKEFVPIIEKLTHVGSILPDDIFDKMITENMMENFDTTNIVNRPFKNLNEAEDWMRNRDK